MTAPDAFRSALAETIARYVALRQALGRRAEDVYSHLRHLDRFLASRGDLDLTLDTFAAYRQSFEQRAASTRRQRLRVVYRFCLFRRRDTPTCFVPDPSTFPSRRPRPRPYIFSMTEIGHLLAAASGFHASGTSPLQREVARVGVVLLYTTGLRRGEAVRLTIDDYDPAAHVLAIRETKFFKSRLVPLSADAVSELTAYLHARQRVSGTAHAVDPLLGHCRGGRLRPYTPDAFTRLLGRVIRAAGLRTASGGHPRVHDLRFTFAVQALLRWYQNGVDVQARLPALATYLGHSSILSTEYYLSFLPATAEAASQRFHRHWVALLPSPPAGGTS
jgi:integrase/recombinase XerD